MAGVDNRRAPRVPLDVRVNFAFDAIAHTKDISEGGVCIISEEPLEEGKFLNLVFGLPDRDHDVQVIGKVMWSKKSTENFFENGVQFWDISDEAQKEIKDYLRRNAI